MTADQAARNYVRNRQRFQCVSSHRVSMHWHNYFIQKHIAEIRSETCIPVETREQFVAAIIDGQRTYKRVMNELLADHYDQPNATPIMAGWSGRA